MSGTAPILLLSMPQMADPNFARAVVLLCDYTEEGAFGPYSGARVSRATAVMRSHDKGL